MKMNIGRWEVEFDKEATRRYYEMMEEGAALRCGCTGCLNFEAVKGEYLPKPLVKKLKGFGINPFKTVSVRRVAPLEDGNSLYAGSYAVIGKIVKGEESARSGDARLDIFENIAPGAHLALRKWNTPPSPWPEEGCVRVRFLVTLPWNGEDPETPLDLATCKGPADREDDGDDWSNS